MERLVAQTGAVTRVGYRSGTGIELGEAMASMFVSIQPILKS